MPAIIPSVRPSLTTGDLQKLLDPFQIPDEYRLIVVGLRGFFSKLMGEDGNQRGRYDDALFLYAPGIQVPVGFNGNTDPSDSAVGRAVLESGKVYYAHKFALHKGEYLALCQRLGPVTVLRDGKAESWEDTGEFGINIHRGGYTTTGSLGCQTIYPLQWDRFIQLAESLARAAYGAEWQNTVVPYALLDYVFESEEKSS